MSLPSNKMSFYTRILNSCEISSIPEDWLKSPNRPSGGLYYEKTGSRNRKNGFGKNLFHAAQHQKRKNYFDFDDGDHLYDFLRPDLFFRHSPASSHSARLYAHALRLLGSDDFTACTIPKKRFLQINSFFTANSAALSWAALFAFTIILWNGAFFL